MKAIVTGGAGFIGSNLVDGLLARGDEVAVIDDFSSGKEGNLEGSGAIVHRADIRDAARIAEIFETERPDVVFHLAAQIDVRLSVTDPAYDARTNVEGTINLLNAALATGARRFVFASTGGAIYGETETVPTPETVAPAPMAPYGTSKLCAEQYLGLFDRLHGLSTVAMRFGNVYGPRQDPHGEAGVIAIFCGKLQKGERPLIYGTGEQTRDYIYVGDVVSGLIAAGDSAVGGAINLGTEEETSVLRLVELLGEHAGDGGFEPEFKETRLGEIDRSCLAVGRAGETIGWQAQVKIDEGLRRTFEWAQTV
ncbi:MAG: NAD-dependent epimerase/dehydratase family protein [Solirubrobacteraceae bacterium]